MPLTTKDFPQANRLDKVIQTVMAISQSQHTDESIGRFLGRSRGRPYDERQGRYYRLATEMLRLTRRPRHNYSTLTSIGRTLLTKSELEQMNILMDLVLKLPVTKYILAMLSSSGGQVSIEAIDRALEQLANTTVSMADRRQASIISWLIQLQLIRKEERRITLLNASTNAQTIEINDLNVPVIPRPQELRRFEEVPRRLSEAKGTIKHEIDAQILERRNETHRRLLQLLSSKIKSHGVFPTNNNLIDLAARIGDVEFIFEVKSSVSKMRQQIRRAVSQLYEYRYLQDMPNAKLVLLVESPLAGKDAWLLDYLTRDRGICVMWDNHGDDLFTTEDCSTLLPFL